MRSLSKNTKIATRTCIFCGTTPTSAEHLFPAWIGRLFKKRGIDGIHRYGSSEKGIIREWKDVDPLQYKVKAVCRNCNNGWMSDIENQALPILSQMITGKANSLNPLVLNKQTKKIISIWLVLRAIIYWQFEKELPDIPSSWVQFIKKNESCPVGWSVWIGANNGVVAPYYLEITSELEILEKDVVVVHPGLLMTGNIGNFVFKVLALINSDRSVSYTKPDCIIRTFPSNNESVSWPPKAIMDKDSMEHFFNHGTHSSETLNNSGALPNFPAIIK